MESQTRKLTSTLEIWEAGTSGVGWWGGGMGLGPQQLAEAVTGGVRRRAGQAWAQPGFEVT